MVINAEEKFARRFLSFALANLTNQETFIRMRQINPALALAVGKIMST